MNVKTINLTGSEVAVAEFDGVHVYIRNDSTDTVYVAKTAELQLVIIV